MRITEDLNAILKWNCFQPKARVLHYIPPLFSTIVSNLESYANKGRTRETTENFDFTHYSNIWEQYCRVSTSRTMVLLRYGSTPQRRTMRVAEEGSHETNEMCSYSGTSFSKISEERFPFAMQARNVDEMVSSRERGCEDVISKREIEYE